MGSIEETLMSLFVCLVSLGEQKSHAKASKSDMMTIAGSTVTNHNLTIVSV